MLSLKGIWIRLFHLMRQIWLQRRQYCCQVSSQGLVGLCGSGVLSPTDALPRKGTEHRRCCMIQGNYSAREKCTTCLYCRLPQALFLPHHSKVGIDDELCLDNKSIELGRFHAAVHQTKRTEHQAGSLEWSLCFSMLLTKPASLLPSFLWMTEQVKYQKWRKKGVEKSTYIDMYLYLSIYSNIRIYGKWIF